MRDWAKLSLGVALSSFSYHEHPLPLKQDFHKMWIAAHVKKIPTVESQACRKTYQIHAGELAPFSPSTLQPSFCSSPAAFDVLLCCTLNRSAMKLSFMQKSPQMEIFNISTNHFFMAKSSCRCRHTFKQHCVDWTLILSLNFLTKMIFIFFCWKCMISSLSSMVTLCLPFW